MDLKKIIAKEAIGRILPMDSDKPKVSKGRLAGALALLAAVLTAASQLIGG